MADTEKEQAEIIKRVYQGGYSHAENILLRLNELTKEHDHDTAIRIVHQEVCGEEQP